MSVRRICHIRSLDLGCIMSYRDMMRALQEMKQAYPELVFFAPADFYDMPGRIDPMKRGQSGDKPSRDLTTFHTDATSCFAALREEQVTFERAPAIRMAMRAPWPEETASGDVMRMRGGNRSGHFFFEADDLAHWHEKGRLVDMTVPAVEPRTVLSVEASQNKRLLHPPSQLPNETAFPPESFGGAREIDPLCQFAQAFTWYNSDDLETTNFMKAFKTLFNKHLTARVAWYDPATGRYLGKDPGSFRYRIGRDLLAWLSHNPGVYDGFYVLHKGNSEFEGRIGGIGPAPDFKAEVFLEAGLPIDDIDGLTIEERDRLLRRHEKKMKNKGTCR